MIMYFDIVMLRYSERGSVSEAIFARTIYQQRKEMNLSLRELARITGIAASTISRIENGHLSPTLDIVAKLTAALNLEPLPVNPAPSATFADPVPTDAREAHTQDLPAQIVSYRKLETTTLHRGVRRDLSRIAARNGYEMAVLLRGTLQLRTNDAFKEELRPGATINCKLIAKHTYFAIAIEEAELLWIG
jgi:transcriptional regulator with XRE-family HTH domain